MEINELSTELTKRSCIDFVLLSGYIFLIVCILTNIENKIDNIQPMIINKTEIYNIIDGDTLTKEINVDTILSHIKQYEGLRLKYYSDGGVPAIGYGHRMFDKVMKSITQVQADSLLHSDYIKKHDYIVKKFKLKGNKAKALALFIFNCGEGTLHKNVKFINALNNGSDIKPYILQYCHYKGKVHSKLLERRNYELKLYNT
jgi:GH24 family phage-related lysozyme (muramidase)